MRKMSFVQVNIYSINAYVDNYSYSLFIFVDLDVGGILKLINDNFQRNSGIIKCKSMRVMELDFMANSWTQSQGEIIKETDVILAADGKRSFLFILSL